MKLKPKKRFGFTLMEILLAVFIVVILAMATMPVINKQLEKADEYSYYMAFKTVEKLGGQIVALGDESKVAMKDSDFKFADSNQSFGNYLANKVDVGYKNLKMALISNTQKLVNSEIFIFKKLFPKSTAEVITLPVDTTDTLFTSSSYDELWLAYRVCAGHKIIKKRNYENKTTNNSDGTTSTEKVEKDPTYYEKEDFGNCLGYTKASGDTYKNLEIATGILANSMCDNNAGTLETIAEKIKNQESPDASVICAIAKPNCHSGGTYTDPNDDISKSVLVDYFPDNEDSDGDDTSGGSDDDAGDNTDYTDFVEPPSSLNPGTCKISLSYTLSYNTNDTEPAKPVVPKFYDSDCTANGYKGAINEPGNGASYLHCVCPSGKINSINNYKYCVSPCTDTTKGAYSDSQGNLQCCSTDFNDKKGVCCPAYSYYAGGDECQCIEGYKENSAGQCERWKCSPGSTFKDGVCVANPPILKAQNFCNKIKENWNTNDSNCSSGLTTADGVKVNTPVFNAATGTDGEYLSVRAKKSSFKNVTPNIVLTNGLKLWILGDKSASISGLSSSPTGAKATQNMCKKITLATPSAAACANYGSGTYYCKSENNCYEFANASNKTLDDPRNCCQTVDLSDYATAAAGAGTPDAYYRVPEAYAISGFTVFVDINGEKGSGTLWEDVYPFYVGANGATYPGYPLNAPKSDNNASNSLYVGGNSDLQLPVDVYYYETRNNYREKKVAFTNVSYARGICSARKVSKYTPYCMNLGEKYYNTGKDGAVLDGSSYITDDDPATSKNPCDTKPCFVSVRKKLKSF